MPNITSDGDTSNFQEYSDEELEIDPVTDREARVFDDFWLKLMLWLIKDCILQCQAQSAIFCFRLQKPSICSSVWNQNP